MLIPSFAAVIAALNISLGADVGGFFLETVAKELNEELIAGATPPVDVQRENSSARASRPRRRGTGSNLMLLLAYLYNYGVAHCTLIYDIVRLLVDGELFEGFVARLFPSGVYSDLLVGGVEQVGAPTIVAERVDFTFFGKGAAFFVLRLSLVKFLILGTAFHPCSKYFDIFSIVTAVGPTAMRTYDSTLRQLPIMS